ncbi:ferrochelatase [Echinimonas agarilytica]|uniref:Ferrochelatase n=1 Tax=Echinimonas agarilytica TaxID=1215918 RepID=A0AA42B872_9GAMM|nr:ferrochelatase [Echinimonas agarilytica]MCM2680006.1 ferrochelatase [Echinimonas agarilytica]
MELKLKHEAYGVLLVNLGTPDAPTASAVRRYLKQFLSDRRVVDVPRAIWWPVLNGIILPIRSPKVAKAYASIWEEDSPLRSIGQQQAEQLASRLIMDQGLDCPVELAMTYGQPSIPDGIANLMNKGVKRIVVLPLYPQYSATTTGSVADAIANALRDIRHIPEIRMVPHYYDHHQYIKGLAGSVKMYWAQHGQPEKLMMSFHGIPQRYARLGDPYPDHCEATAKAVAKELNLRDDQWIQTYQSRFGREPWLQPYTDKTLEALPDKGVRSIDVICPAFASDCLETLEEIAEENRDIFMEAGGQQYRYIPALNAAPCHARLMSSLVSEQLKGW